VFFFPDGVKITEISEADIKAICWEECKRISNMKRHCYNDECPLGKIQRIYNMRDELVASWENFNEQIAIQREEQLAIEKAILAAEHRCIMMGAAAVLF